MTKYKKYNEISEFVGLKPYNKLSTMKKENPAKFLLLNLAMEYRDEIIKNADDLYPWILEIQNGKVINKYQTLDDLPDGYNKNNVVYCLNGKKHYLTYKNSIWRYDV